MSLTERWVASLAPPRELFPFLQEMAKLGVKPGDSDDPAEFMRDLLVEVELLSHTAKGWDDFLSAGDLSLQTLASPSAALLQTHARMTEAGELDGAGAAVFADALQKLWKPEAARIAALSAFSLGVGTLTVFGLLFNLALESGRVEAAEELCSLIVRESPDGPEGRYCRARIAKFSGDFAQAGKLARALAADFQGYRPAYRLAAECLAQTGDWGGLLDFLDEVPAQFSNDETLSHLRCLALLNFALVCLKERKFAEAAELAGAVIMASPALASQAWLIVSDAFRFSGASAEARSALDEALAASQGNPQIRAEVERRLSQPGFS